MKKSLVLMALAGVALASCVNDVADVAQNEQKKALIGFQSPVIYQNATSRYVAGEISGTKYPTGESFMVAASKSATDWSETTEFWDGFQEVSYVGAQNGWKTSKDYYWPTYSLSFVAYSPAGLVGTTTLADVTYTNAGWNFDDFVVPTDQTQKIDLLYSDLIEDQTSNGNNGGYYGVPVVFKHALSSIHFKVVTDVTEADVILKSITISEVKYKGDFDGTDWAAADDVESYETDGSNLEFDTDGEDVANSLLLMPQALTDVTMVVKYSVNGVEKYTSPISLYNLKQNETTFITAWEPGHRYTYILNYSALAEDLIYFAPSVTDWDDVSLTINLN